MTGSCLDSAWRLPHWNRKVSLSGWHLNMAGASEEEEADVRRHGRMVLRVLHAHDRGQD